MGAFTLRDPTGGSALRDGDSLRDALVAVTFREGLADLLVLSTPETGWLVDEANNPLVDENSESLYTGGSGGDRLSHTVTVAEVLGLGDGMGGGTAFGVTGASTVTFTTIGADTFGGGAGTPPVAYTHVGADPLILTTAGGDALNVITLPVVIPGREWGRTQRWNAWVEILVAREVAASSAEGDFALVGGTITDDLTRSITQDVSVELAFPSSATRRHRLVPTQIGDLLDPSAGSLLRVWGGYEGSEMVMGTFDLAAVTISTTSAGVTVRASGHSLERLLQKAGFWRTVAVADFTLSISLIRQLVEEVVGGSYFIYDPIQSWTPPLTFKPGDNRLDKITEVAAAAGIEFRADRNGTWRMFWAPTSAIFGLATPQWEIVDGVNARVATLTTATREFSDDETFNGVVIEGDSHASDESPPIVYALWNTQPGSPLYFNPNNPSSSRMGPRPKHIRTELISTQGEAAVMAEAELVKTMMLVDAVKATMPANAALEAGAYARLRAAGMGLDATYRISRVVHDLAGGSVSADLFRAEWANGGFGT